MKIGKKRSPVYKTGDLFFCVPHSVRVEPSCLQPLITLELHDLRKGTLLLRQWYTQENKNFFFSVRFALQSVVYGRGSAAEPIGAKVAFTVTGLASW